MFSKEVESYMDPVVLNICHMVISTLHELNISTRLSDYRSQNMTCNLYYKNLEIGTIIIQYYDNSPTKTYITYRWHIHHNHWITLKSYGSHLNIKSYFTRLLNRRYFVAPLMVLAWRKKLIPKVPKELLLYIFEYV